MQKPEKHIVFFQLQNEVPVALPFLCADGENDVDALPDEILKSLCSLLRFSRDLLHHATSKSVYASSPYLIDLLGAASDDVSDLALEVLHALSMPPALHKQASPEQHAHTTELHQMSKEHDRIISMAHGWGSRDAGIDMRTMASADDSVHGQGILPPSGGQVQFMYWSTGEVQTELSTIVLTRGDILVDGDMFVDDSSGDESGNKRRRVGARESAKPTSQLFFLALRKGKGRTQIPIERQFSLLVHIRLACCYYSCATRVQAIERQLRSIITMLHSQPAHELITIFLQAHPELCSQTIDLLRSMVSSSNLSSVSSSCRDPIAGIIGAHTDAVPITTRILAVDALAGLVCRRGGVSGVVYAGSLPLTNVLTELGVGKGTYLGLLPSLIRYTLATLDSVSKRVAPQEAATDNLGVAFVEALSPSSGQRLEEIEQALHFVDSVLTLTASVISTPNGTSALVHCGLVPTLLSVISVDSEQTLSRLLMNTEVQNGNDTQRVRSWLCYIASQVVQILEAVFVTESSALTSFQELGGTEVLIKRIEDEIECALGLATKDSDGDAVMGLPPRAIPNSTRVVLFALLTCLAVTFHQDSSSSSAGIVSGETYLRKPSLTKSIVSLLENANLFGGQIISLVANILTEVLNSDPTVVHHTHESGIGKTFLDMVADTSAEGEPTLPAVPELLMAIPNVICALALTEAGAKAVENSNPFPVLLRIFQTKKYVMPRSRCLLNEMSAIIATGLDEIARHVEVLSPLVLKAVSEALQMLVKSAQALVEDETSSPAPDDIDERRTCLIQYVMNFCQLLEQVLQHDTHCKTFVKDGGFNSLLQLFSVTMPSGHRLLSLLSGMSSPSVGSLHHSTIEVQLASSLKHVFCLVDAKETINAVVSTSSRYLDEFDDIVSQLPSAKSFVDRFPLELFTDSSGDLSDELQQLSAMLRKVAQIQWITSVLASVIKEVYQKAMGGGSPSDSDWSTLKSIIASPDFRGMLEKLVEFHKRSLWDACQFRATDRFETEERLRLSESGRHCFLLRIVCPEGAVVRDGIDIDSCRKLGTMEMGEIVNAFERCINSSGILRYRTSRGWVSETTRGHGREPISEVLSIGTSASDATQISYSCEANEKRLHAGVPDLRTVATNVFARGQSGLNDVMSAISKVAIQSLHDIQPANLSFDKDSNGTTASSTVSLLASCMQRMMSIAEGGSGESALALFTGCNLRLLNVCLFDERKEKVINFPLLVHWLGSTEKNIQSDGLPMYKALRMVMEFCLGEFKQFSMSSNERVQQMSRTVAACLPSLLCLLRKLLSAPIVSCNGASIMNRLQLSDVARLTASSSLTEEYSDKAGHFAPENFVADMHLVLSDMVKDAWQSDGLQYAPTHVLYPFSSLIGDVIVCLDSNLKKPTGNPPGQNRLLLSEFVRRSRQARREELFEPSEEVISQMAEMGFSRDHAIDALENTRSNRVEVAMDYALSHGPPSPATVQRTRERREARANGEPGDGNDDGGTDQPTETSKPITTSGEGDNTNDTLREKRLEATKSALEAWKIAMPDLICRLLASCGASSFGLDMPDILRIRERGDADLEARTVVLSSLLLDFGNRYPTERDVVVNKVLSTLHDVVLRTLDGDDASQGDLELSLTALSHSVVIVIRAWPTTRLLVLQKNLLTPLVDCIHSQSSRKVGKRLAAWVSPMLLLVDAMCQPSFDLDESIEPGGSDDLREVLEYHEKTNAELTKRASALFALLMTPTEPEQPSLSLNALPTFLPMLPPRIRDKCLDICVGLIMSRVSCEPALTPALCHAVLMLLGRLLRSPMSATKCMNVGLAESILALPESCRFNGNAGVVTLVLRRLLEDGATLQSAMEAEIKSTFIQLSKKHSDDGKRVSLSSFLEALTPLLCRDPETFMTAFVLCVSTSSDASFVELVSLVERRRREDCLSRTLGSSSRESQQEAKRVRHGRSKSPTKKHYGSRRKSKERTGGTSSNPSARIVSLLINRIMDASLSDSGVILSTDEASSFLWTGSLLRILADLVITFPSCASAVHNFRVPKWRDKQKRNLLHIDHAMGAGSPQPPRTFVSLILHRFLSLDRWSLRMDDKLWERSNGEKAETDPEVKERRNVANVVKQLSQASARVLAALVARPGDGRKRVVCELIFAISGGLIGSSFGMIADPQPQRFIDTLSSPELSALQSWGELCVGFISPRSNGRNIEGAAILNAATVKIMLENGMVHAILLAVNQVGLTHAMASATLSALLHPLEVLTRPAVTFTIESQTKTLVAVKRDTEEQSGDVEIQNDLNDEEDIQMMDVDDGQQSDNEGSGSDEVEEGEEDVDSASDSSDDDESEDDEDDLSESTSSGHEEVEDEENWDVGFDSNFAADEDAPHEMETEANEDEDATQEEQQDFDEGWLRIDSSSFGGMMLGSVPNGSNPRQEAEEMIGTLLREAEINGDTLAQIEGSLGIRLMAGGRSLRDAVAGRTAGDTRAIPSDHSTQNQGSGGHASNRPSNDLAGVLPYVHQRQRPEVGYSTFGRRGNWVDTNAMEFVYGGPSVTTGSRNYDVITPFEDPRVTGGWEQGISRQVDLLLFPGGPASAASIRAHQSTHPLLCGIHLPPMNALVSDMLPHGIRATHSPGQSHATHSGEWPSSSTLRGGFLASNGNIVTNRLQAGSSMFSGMSSRQNTDGAAIGWSDDGLLVEPAVQNFGSAFRSSILAGMSTSAGQGEDETSEAQMENTRHVASEAQDQSQANSTTDNVDPTTSNNENEENESQEMEIDTEEADQIADPSTEPTAAVALNQDSGDVATGRENGVENEDILEEERQVETGSDEARVEHNEDMTERAEEQEESETAPDGNRNSEDELQCPPDFDPEVFNCLPVEMQRDCVAQYNATQDLASQLNGSSLDPEVLAALPEDMRREVIEQDQRERRRREEAPADPSHAEDMDPASFVASLTPELREEVLLTADEAFLRSLPPNLAVEAQVLRERSSTNRNRLFDTLQTNDPRRSAFARSQNDRQSDSKRKRAGKVKVEGDSKNVVYLPDGFPPPFSRASLERLVCLYYLMIPVIKPPRIMHRLFQNLCSDGDVRRTLCSTFVHLLNNEVEEARVCMKEVSDSYGQGESWRRAMDLTFKAGQDFPPASLLGSPPDSLEYCVQKSSTAPMLRHRLYIENGLAATKINERERFIPPVVASRMLDCLSHLCKVSTRFSVHTITKSGESPTSFESMIALLKNPQFSSNSANLDQLLTLLESAITPLSYISRGQSETVEISSRDVESAKAAGKEWVHVPRIVVSQQFLQLLCSILKMETCKDTAFTKVNTIVRRLCRIEQNRGFVLSELASVARSLGDDALRDLQALQTRIYAAVEQRSTRKESDNDRTTTSVGSIAFATSTSELKLLRVLQTLQALCIEGEENVRKSDSATVSEDLVHLLKQMQLESLWAHLSDCLQSIQVLEGVTSFESNGVDEAPSDENEEEEETAETAKKAKKLRSSSSGILTRFLPTIEAFFVCNASAVRADDNKGEVRVDDLVGKSSVPSFVAKNKVVLNALIRISPSLLEKGLRTMVQVPPCRVFLDFDVKRQWFKTQIRRQRQQASRRSVLHRLHLQVRRKHVFEDAYLQLAPRNADEMRGRLQISFRNEEGVDAGGLSREFFAILSKEIFNPNYALFTSTEDGCTFQPNPNSSVNPDHLSFFRFVGRIVGKAVVDGYLLDAHFTRSLYKHMLGLEPTHQDMEAIDPDYYRNLKSILEFELDVLGLELTFSIEDHSFGDTQTIDLVENGRSIAVTEENKEKYVRLVCQHRMTTAIQNQIKAYLDGFYELVSKDMISIFTPGELELLISGLPDIDVLDLKSNTDYVGWKATDKQIEWFWNVLVSLSRNEKAAFLQFVTGSSKVPLTGFAELQGMRGVQKFSIHKVGGSKGALMSAHTCFNSLELPTYSSQVELKDKLLFAITEGAGSFLFA